MSNNLRKFATVAAYQAAELIKPAVSLIEENDDVYFDPKEVPTFGGLTVKYYIEDPTSEVTLFNGGGGGSSSSSDSGSGSGGGGALPTTMIVDGVEETPINTWRFETAGEHIVQYEFENNEIPNQYFTELENITSVTIDSGVTYIGNYAFEHCSGLTSITVNVTTPPYLDVNVFNDTNDCPIYVPSGSVDEYKASTSTGWSAYASRIEAIR